MIYLLWLFWLASGAAAGFAAVQGTRDGAGRLRLAIAGGAFLAGTVLMLVAGTTPAGRPIVPGLARLAGTASTAEKRRHDAQMWEQKLEQQLADARKEEEQFTIAPAPATTGVFSSGTTPAAEEPVVAPSTGRQLTLLAILLLLLVIDGAVLLYAGGIPALPSFGKDPKRDEQLALLDALTALVWEERYRDALAKAAEILELKLRQSELLDLFYLRGYAAVQVHAYPEANETRDYRASLLDGAIKDLEEVLAVSPRHGQALYLLALAFGFAGRHADALATFARAARELDGVTLPFAHNESVCLLNLGEGHLGRADIQEAEACFDRVTRLGQLGASVTQVRIKIAMIDLRSAMSRNATAAAQAILEKAVGFAGLSDEQKRTLAVIGIELNARAALSQGDPDRAAAAAESFLATYLPAGVPPLDDAIADEVFSPLLDSDLVFPRDVYRDILFMLAIARALIETRRRSTLSEADVARIAEPLLRALQFEPRHRDLLAAIGGLYYWTRRDLRPQARAWLEAAVTMGVDSRYVRIILARDRAIEEERRDVLDLFRSASSRFLRDRSLAAEMRRALVEELGRFQEFEPMLIELQEKHDYDAEEPTLATLRDRAKYLADLADNAMRRGDTARYARLATLKADYARTLAGLEESAKAIEALERAVIVELGSALAMA